MTKIEWLRLEKQSRPLVCPFLSDFYTDYMSILNLMSNIQMSKVKTITTEVKYSSVLWESFPCPRNICACSWNHMWMVTSSSLNISKAKQTFTYQTHNVILLSALLVCKFNHLNLLIHSWLWPPFDHCFVPLLISLVKYIYMQYCNTFDSATCVSAYLFIHTALQNLLKYAQ